MKSQKKPVVLFVINGLSDLPKEKTPLSVAETPNLDTLAEKGYVGYMNLVSKSTFPTDLNTGLSLLGMNPNKYKVSMGILEAIGANIPIKDGDLAWSCNFGTIDENGKVIDRRANGSDYGLDEITRSINKYVDVGAKYIFLRTYMHKAVLVFKGKFSADLKGNDPLEIGKSIKLVKPLKQDRFANLSSVLTNNFLEKSMSVMEYHEKNFERMNKGLLSVNCLLIRGPGNSLPNLPNFKEKWKIKRAVVVSEPNPLKGICLSSGFDSIEFKSRSFKEDLNFIFSQVPDLMSQFDFILVHLPYPDLYAHKKDFNGKKKVIEEIDKKFEEFIDSNDTIVVMSNHITSVKTGRHEPGPIPVLVYGRGKDRIKKFDEFSVKKGALKKLTPNKLLKLIFKK